MANEFNLPTDGDSSVNKQVEVTLKTWAAVGRGISAWANNETVLVQITAKLLGTSEHKTGLILYSINNFYSWISIIDGLFQIGEFPAAKILWSNVVSEIKAQNDVRVRLAHQGLQTNVYENQETGKLTTVVAGLEPASFDIRPKQQGMKTLTFREIVTFYDDVASTHGKLTKVLVELKKPSALP